MPASKRNYRNGSRNGSATCRDPGWYGREQRASGLKTVAYFSMEFGLGEALPVYSGGLGILAGDYLKTASDLGVPVVGSGSYTSRGTFGKSWILMAGNRRFFLTMTRQASLSPRCQIREGGWLRIRLELPGRPILVRVWQAQVGRATLYLLDSNDLLNSPADRGATALLYPSGEKAAPDPGNYSWHRGLASSRRTRSRCRNHLPSERGARRFCGARACPQLYAPDGTAVLCGALGNQGRQCVYDPYAGRSGVRPISARTDSSPMRHTSRS